MLAIITRQPQSIGESIKATSPHRTYIVQQGMGGYSQNSFYMVRTIITHEELPDLIKAIEIVDPECFYYYHDLDGISRRYHIPPMG